MDEKFMNIELYIWFRLNTIINYSNLALYKMYIHVLIIVFCFILCISSMCVETLHYYSAHSSLGVFSDRLHQVLGLLYVSLDYLSLQQWEYDTTFLTVFILTHPANFALWEETGAKYKIQIPGKQLNCNP
jgi:hypothetical protein